MATRPRGAERGRGAEGSRARRKGAKDDATRRDGMGWHGMAWHGMAWDEQEEEKTGRSGVRRGEGDIPFLRYSFSLCSFSVRSERASRSTARCCSSTVGRFTYKFNKHISYLMHALSRECFDRPGPPSSFSATLFPLPLSSYLFRTRFSRANRFAVDPSRADFVARRRKERAENDRGESIRVVEKSFRERWTSRVDSRNPRRRLTSIGGKSRQPRRILSGIQSLVVRSKSIIGDAYRSELIWRAACFITRNQLHPCSDCQRGPRRCQPPRCTGTDR